MEIRKVSIVGCGALGIMYGSHMQKSLAPGQVQFIADEARIEKYKSAEFYANGERQDFKFVSPDAGAGPSDLVIFTVKYHHLREAVELAKGHVGENTIILSFLNGISSEGILAQTFNPKKILHSMVAGMDATRENGAVTFSKMGYVAFGSLHGANEDVDAVSRLFDKVQMKYEISDDIMKALWWKYTLNIGINQITALLKTTYKLIQTTEYAENLVRMAMAEAQQVAVKLGVGLSDEDIERCVATYKTLSPDGKTSMCQDIEAGRKTEIEMFAGELMALGKEQSVPTPVNAFLFNAIKALEIENGSARQ